MKKQLLILFVLFCSKAVVGQPGIDRFNQLYFESLGRTAALYISKGIVSQADDVVQNNYAAEYFSILQQYQDKASATAFLFYFYSNDSLHICLLNNNAVLFNSTAIAKDSVLHAEAVLRAALGVDEMAAKGMPLQRGTQPLKANAVHKLPVQQAIAMAGNLLLPPNIAAGISRLEHIMILPELNIGRFPFYILQPFGDDRFLIDQLSVSFIPRLLNPSQATGNSIAAGQPFARRFTTPLVVGNPAYSTKGHYIFPPLKAAEEEAESVAGLLQCPYLTGKEATLAVIKNKAQQADLLYFATHAVFDMDKMLQGSFIAFAPDEKDSTGLWMASDIQGNTLPATLAVLSACQTGIGKIYDGGFVSIGQSFYIAGVAHTVSSLWSVDDNSTRELMTGFMHEITTPAFFYPAAQLRKAILAYKKNNSQVARWAAFSVYGF